MAPESNASTISIHSGWNLEGRQSMRRLFFGLIMAIVGMASVGIGAIGQPPRPQSSPRKPSVTKPKPSNRPAAPKSQAAAVKAPPPVGEPLVLDLEKLPAGYVGDSIEAVVSALNPGPKTEFETTSEYNSRVASLRSERTYSFWLDRPILRRYDADRQTLRLGMPTTCVYFGYTANCSVASLLVKTSSQQRGEYVGSNAFGASAVVTFMTRQHYAIILPKNEPGLDFELAMPPEEARQIKDAVDVLVTVGPRTDVNTAIVSEGTQSKSATFSSPSDALDEYKYLNLPVVAVWLANRGTGQVFMKTNLTSQKLADSHPWLTKMICPRCQRTN
jgi:hypothetical protein